MFTDPPGIYYDSATRSLSDHLRSLTFEKWLLEIGVVPAKAAEMAAKHPGHPPEDFPALACLLVAGLDGSVLTTHINFDGRNDYEMYPCPSLLAWFRSSHQPCHNMVRDYLAPFGLVEGVVGRDGITAEQAVVELRAIYAEFPSHLATMVARILEGTSTFAGRFDITKVPGGPLEKVRKLLELRGRKIPTLELAGSFAEGRMFRVLNIDASTI